MYDSVVGACSNQELTDRWQSRGEAYDIGVNSKGMVIFKDRKAALKQALEDYQPFTSKKRRFMPKGVLIGKKMQLY